MLSIDIVGSSKSLETPRSSPRVRQDLANYHHVAPGFQNLIPYRAVTKNQLCIRGKTFSLIGSRFSITNLQIEFIAITLNCIVSAINSTVEIHPN